MGILSPTLISMGRSGERELLPESNIRSHYRSEGAKPAFTNLLETGNFSIKGS